MKLCCAVHRALAEALDGFNLLFTYALIKNIYKNPPTTSHSNKSNLNSPSMVGEFALTEEQMLEIRKVFNLFSKGSK